MLHESRAFNKAPSGRRTPRADPTDWTDVRQLDKLFWLGYMPRSAFDRAVAAKPGAGSKAELAASTDCVARLLEVAERLRLRSASLQAEASLLSLGREDG